MTETVGQWQPIETAPKDEAVLTCRGSGLLAVAELIPDGMDGHEWLVVDGGFIIGVTHWMPLPNPPSPRWPERRRG